MFNNPLLQNPLMVSSIDTNSLDEEDPEIDPLDYSAKFNTLLSAEEEKQFEEWAVQNNRIKDTYDYDIRGAWKDIISGKVKQSANGHLTDKYKKPNHPTFSNQSIYHGKDGYVGGEWGDKEFSPGPTNLKFRKPNELFKYFKEYEPDYKLILPKGK
jgi:hypothetical protein